MWNHQYFIFLYFTGWHRALISSRLQPRGNMKSGSKKQWNSIVPFRLRGKSATRFCMYPKVKSAGRSPGNTPVYLNVYDLTAINGYVYWAGLGVFHSGVEGQLPSLFWCFCFIFEYIEITLVIAYHNMSRRLLHCWCVTVLIMFLHTHLFSFERKYYNNKIKHIRFMI